MANLVTRQQQRTAAAPGAPGAATPIGEKPSALRSVSKALQKLSAREKFIICALVVLALVMALAFFLVFPATERLAQAQQDLESLRAEESTTRMTIARIPDDQALLDNSQMRYAEYLLKYQAPLLPEEIDRMLTTLAEECGFSTTSVSFSPFALESIVPYAPGASVWEVLSAVEAATASDTAAGIVPDTSATGEATGTVDGTSMDSGFPAVDPTDNGGTGGEDATSSPDMMSGTGDMDAAASAEAVPEDAQTLVFSVNIAVLGYDESYFAFLDRLAPLTWIKVISSSYTPPTYVYDENGMIEEQAYSLSLCIYAHAEASPKQP